MKQLIITGEDLITAGYPESPAVGMLISIAAEKFDDNQKEEAINTFKQLLAEPLQYIEDETYAAVAKALLPADDTINLSDAKPYTVYGTDYIEDGARKQMDVAVRLPVAVAGALMPDAHQGYGLPIGGVLATNNAIIPYGVGVDIGCRMCLSIYDIPEQHFIENQSQYKRDLIAYTKFGAGAGYHGHHKTDHAVLNRKEFNEIAMLRPLFDKAYSQLGTSGGGNHFVEWGIIEMLSDKNEYNIPAGKYLALLSHSGSRGTGATIANHYTKLAKQICKLPKEAANLAYLSLDSAEGQEYWSAMNLAGDYASACHEVIHNKLTKAVGGQLLARVENHHNFAWEETLNGQNVIVHRKGATPASEGVMGIIPGSMTAPGYLVRGKGLVESINSASHGAGRQMSRTRAEQTFTRKELQAILKDHGVSLIGGGLDEAPGAYKDINMVMNAQQDLVDIIARFKPKLVRMADDGSKED